MDHGSETSRQRASVVARIVQWTWLVMYAGLAIGAVLLLRRWDASADRPMGLLVGSVACTGWLVALMYSRTRGVASLPVMLVLGPVSLSATRMRPPVVVEQITQYPESVPAKSVELIDGCRVQLERLGFVSLGRARMFGPTTLNAAGRPDEGAFELFEHQVTRHSAAIMLGGCGLPGYIPQPIVRFLENLDSGRQVGVLNSSTPRMFPRADDGDYIQLPSVHDVATLYRVQLAMLDRYAPSHSPRGNLKVGLMPVLDAENQSTIDKWIARRWIVPTAEPGLYRFPLWMMVRAGWGLIPVIARIRVWLLSRETARKLRDLDPSGSLGVLLT